MLVLGADDDTDCPHMWRLADVDFRPDGSWSDYVCDLCDGRVLVAPGGTHPVAV